MTNRRLPSHSYVSVAEEQVVLWKRLAQREIADSMRMHMTSSGSPSHSCVNVV